MNQQHAERVAKERRELEDAIAESKESFKYHVRNFITFSSQLKDLNENPEEYFLASDLCKQLEELR